MKKEKEPKDLLLECLTDIEKDLIDAKDDASKSRYNKTEQSIERAIGRIRNFKTIISYLEGG